jgi:pyruvate dehydrogenase E1 component alpha subunit
MSDPAKYRTKEEVNRMRQERDPIDNVKERLIEANVAEEELKEMDKLIRDAVSEAVEFAQKSKEPDPSELYTDVLI